MDPRPTDLAGSVDGSPERDEPIRVFGVTTRGIDNVLDRAINVA